jgi:hypothetical protein
VEVVHVVGFVFLVGTLFVFDLRLLGFLARLPIDEGVRTLTRWARWGLVLVVPSGILLFVVDATTLAGNPAFRLKLVLLVAAAVNAVVFHRVTWKRWIPDHPVPLPARLAGALSILIWISVLTAGSLIPYR